MKRHLHTPGTRAKMTIRALLRYGRERGAWPSAAELSRRNPRLGSPATILRQLRALAAIQSPPLVRLVRRASESYWQPGADAFAVVSVPPFTIVSPPSRKARRSRFYPRRQRARKLRGRLDAARALDLASTGEGNQHQQAARVTSADFANLPVYG